MEWDLSLWCRLVAGVVMMVAIFANWSPSILASCSPSSLPGMPTCLGTQLSVMKHCSRSALLWIMFMRFDMELLLEVDMAWIVLSESE